MIKTAVFLGDSRKRIRDFPEEAKAVAGRELYRVQRGLDPADWKAMNTVGAGVREIRVQEAGQFRVIYVAKFAEAIYVLHAFQKGPRGPRSGILSWREGASTRWLKKGFHENEDAKVR
jgi:phage-related protein